MAGDGESTAQEEEKVSDQHPKQVPQNSSPSTVRDDKKETENKLGKANSFSKSQPETSSPKPEAKGKVTEAQKDDGPKISKEQLELVDKWRTWCVQKFGSPGDAFKKMDDNGNGTISCTELVHHCASWERGSAVKKVFQILNHKVKDGIIVWSEFVSADLPIENSAKWVAEAEKAGIKDAPKTKATLPPELTKEEKIQLELGNFQNWCASTFDSPKEVLAHFDTNGSGRISCSQFIDRCGAKRRGKPLCPGDKDIWKAIFKIFDSENSGIISKKELYESMRQKFKSKQGTHKEAAAPKQSPKAGQVNSSSAPLSCRTKMPDAGSEIEWTNRTELNLRGAECLVHNIKSQLRDHVLDGDGGLCKLQQHSESQNLSNDLDTKLRKRIARCTEAAKATETQIAGCMDAGNEMKSCVRAMRNAHRQLWMTLSVCETRLDLRENRAPSEQVRDNFQKALEEEWEITANAREDLVERITKGERMLLALEQVKEELTSVLYTKRRDARMDHARMMANQRPQVDLGSSWACHSSSSGGTCSLPPAAPADKHPPALTEVQNSQIDDKAVMARAARLEEIARKLCAAGDAAIEAGKQACKEAAAKTEQHMDNRVKKVVKLQDALHKRLVLTQGFIHEAEVSFGRSLLGQLNSTSQMSGSGETDLGAPLLGQDSLELDPSGQGSLEFDSDVSLSKKWQATANVLCRLKQSGVRLQEDLKHKVHALRIDGRCRKVTPRYASTELGRIHRPGEPMGGQLAKVPRKNKQVSEVVEKTFTTI